MRPRCGSKFDGPCWVLGFGVALCLAACSASAQAKTAPRCSAEAFTRDGPLRADGQEARQIETRLAGVPAIVRFPKRVSRPPIVLWHGFAAPDSEASLMEALPLDEVDAVKVYLGLPLFGRRAPQGASETLAQRQTRDYGLALFAPSVVGAAEELSRVVSELHAKGCLAPGGRISLFGFSAGGSAVLVSLLDHQVPVGAAVVLNAPVGLEPAVHAFEHATGRAYAWSPPSRALASRTDAIGHARQLAAGAPPPAILLMHSGADEVVGGDDMSRLHRALLPYYARSSRRLALHALPELPHTLANDPSWSGARHVIADWFNTPW